MENALVAKLLQFGSWITVSNIISPVMAYLDRFLIGAMVSVAAVAYYVTPYSIVTKILIVPFAIVRVLFPAFAMSIVQDHNHTVLLFTRSVKFVYLTVFPMALLILCFAKPGLELWLGKEFSEQGAHVMQLLTIGLFFNCLAQIPFSLIQSAGKPALTAKIHLIELPFYIVAVWWMTISLGIEGTAIVWSARAIVDALFMFVIALRLLPQGSVSYQKTIFAGGLALFLLLIGMIPKEFTLNFVLLIITLFPFIWASWFFLLDNEERLLLKNFLKKRLDFLQRIFHAQ